MNQTKSAARFLVTAAVISALYAGATTAFAPISFANIQFRVAEALTILPAFTTAAIPGLAVGCALANLIGVATGANLAGVLDIPIGSFATLLAAVLSYYLRGVKWKGVPFLVPLPPVVVNLFIIGAELSVVLKLPFWLCALQVGVGQLVICYGLGIPLYLALQKSGAANRWRLF